MRMFPKDVTVPHRELTHLLGMLVITLHTWPLTRKGNCWRAWVSGQRKAAQLPREVRIRPDRTPGVSPGDKPLTVTSHGGWEWLQPALLPRCPDGRARRPVLGRGLTFILPPLSSSLSLSLASTTLFKSLCRRRPKSLNIVEPPERTTF